MLSSHMYEFSREFGDVIHSNPPTYNIGHRGEPVRIARRIRAAFPERYDPPNNKYITTFASSNVLKVTFTGQTALSGAESGDLADIISGHKALIDWPYTG